MRTWLLYAWWSFWCLALIYIWTIWFNLWFYVWLWKWTALLRLWLDFQLFYVLICRLFDNWKVLFHLLHRTYLTLIRFIHNDWLLIIFGLFKLILQLFWLREHHPSHDLLLTLALALMIWHDYVVLIESLCFWYRYLLSLYERLYIWLRVWWSHWMLGLGGYHLEVILLWLRLHRYIKLVILRLLHRILSNWNKNLYRRWKYGLWWVLNFVCYQLSLIYMYLTTFNDRALMTWWFKSLIRTLRLDKIRRAVEYDAWWFLLNTALAVVNLVFNTVAISDDFALAACFFYNVIVILKTEVKCLVIRPALLLTACFE